MLAVGDPVSVGLVETPTPPLRRGASFVTRAFMLLDRLGVEFGPRPCGEDRNCRGNRWGMPALIAVLIGSTGRPRGYGCSY